MVNATQLNALLGQEITQICSVGYTSKDDNHCAHFLSHVLGYQFGTTCRVMASGQGTPACIRVFQLFERCRNVGRWQDKPVPLFIGLVFITNAGNVHLKTKKMDNVPRKHVGIFLGGDIWHYSNKLDKVVKQTPAEFVNHYPAPDNAMFYGDLP
jgi:hypothetical protein